MARDPIQLPTPRLGLNVDAPGSQIDDEEAQVFINAVVGEQGDYVDTRGPLGETGTWTPDGSNPHVYDSAAYETDIIWSTGAEGFSRLYHVDTNDTTRPFTVNEMTGSSTSNGKLGAEINEGVTPMSQVVRYNNSVYWVQFGRWETTNNADEGAVQLGPDIYYRIVRWGGNTDDTENEDLAVTINNGSTSGTIATPTANLQDKIMYDAASGGEFSYKVVTHTGTGTTIIIDKPYGLGYGTSRIANASGKTLRFGTFAPVMNAPYSTVQGGLMIWKHYGRLYCMGAGEVSGVYGSGSNDNSNVTLRYSEPEEFEDWPSDNYFVLDGGDEDLQATGFATVDSNMVIFHNRQINIMTGYNDATFEIRPLVLERGCLDYKSITHHDNGVFYASQEGLMFFSQNGFENLTMKGPGRGIDKIWQEHTNSHFKHIMTRKVGKHYLFLTFIDGTSSTEETKTYYMDLRTGAWAEFQIASGVTSGEWDFDAIYRYSPDLWKGEGWDSLALNESYQQTYALSNSGYMLHLDEAFEEPSTPATREDDYSGTQIPIPFQIRYKDFRFSNTEMTKVRGLRVEHDHYYGGTQSSKTGWTLRVSYSPTVHWQTGDTEGSVKPRYEATYTDIGHYYVNELLEGDFNSGQGSVVRVDLFQEPTSTTGDAPYVARLYNIKLLSEPTKDGIVDDDPTE